MTQFTEQKLQGYRNKYLGHRVTFTRNGQKCGGQLQTLGYNHFPSHGLTASFDRGLTYNLTQQELNTFNFVKTLF